MKRVVFLIILALLLAPIVFADFLGLKEAPEWIRFPLIEPIDSTGIGGPPDSVHVFTTIMNSTNDLAFSTRSTTYPFTAAGIDTSNIYGDTTYWFADQIQDIDGSAGANEALSIKVVLFFDGLPTPTHASFQKVPDTLSHLFDSLYAALDSIQSQSTWVAQEASLFTTAQLAEAFWEYDSSLVTDPDGMGVLFRDTLAAILAGASGLDTLSTAFVDRLLGRFADSVWKSDSADYNGVAGSFGQFLSDSLIIDVSVLGLITAADLTDTIYNRDTSDNVLTGSFGLVIQELYDENQRIGDSIDVFETWIAQEASLFTTAQLAEAFWEYDSSLVTDPDGMGVLLRDTLDAILAGASGLDTLATAFVDRLLGRMADSLWKSDTADYNGVSGSFGEILSDPTYVQGAASGLTATEIADTIYNRDTSDNVLAGSFGLVIQELYDENQRIGDSIDILETWIAQQASLFDPTTDSVLVDVSTAGAAGGLLATATDSLLRRTLADDTTALLVNVADYIFAGGDTLSWATVSDIAEATWEYDSSLVTDPDGMGVLIRDTLDAILAGASGLDTLSTVFVDRLVGRTADTVWLSLLADRDGVTGSFGDSAKAWTGGSAVISDADMAAIADTILNRDTSDNVVAGSFGFVIQELYDENQRIGDSIDVFETWIAQEASLFDPSTDSVLVDGSAFALTGGAISALTIALNAIGADELAASAAEEIRDSNWDARLTGLTFNTPTSAGRRLRELSDANIITTGTAQRGTVLSIVIAAGTSFPDSILNGNQIVIIAGTGMGQARHIETWTDATDSIGLHGGDGWVVVPDNTSEYEVRFAGATEVIHIHDSAICDIWCVDTTGLKVTGSFGEAVAESDTVGIFTMLINNIFARLSVDTTFDVDAEGNAVISSLNDIGEIVAVMPDDWTLADSIAYQGPGSSLTKEQIAQATIDSIRNASPALPATPTDTTISGNLVGDCTGNGPNNLTVFAIDTANGDTLSGVAIFITNLTGAPEAEGTTGPTGSVTFGLTTATWRAQAGSNQTLYNFDDTTFAVTLPFDTVAILGYPQFIPDPVNPDLANVFAHLRSILGDPVDSVIVTLQLVTRSNVASTSNGFTIGENLAVDTSDATGFFLFPAVRSFIYDDSLRSFYKITGKLRKKTKFVIDSIRIPDTGNVDITDEIGALFP